MNPTMSTSPKKKRCKKRCSIWWERISFLWSHVGPQIYKWNPIMSCSANGRIGWIQLIWLNAYSRVNSWINVHSIFCPVLSLSVFNPWTQERTGIISWLIVDVYRPTVDSTAIARCGVEDCWWIMMRCWVYPSRTQHLMHHNLMRSVYRWDSIFLFFLIERWVIQDRFIIDHSPFSSPAVIQRSCTWLLGTRLLTYGRWINLGP